MAHSEAEKLTIASSDIAGMEAEGWTLILTESGDVCIGDRPLNLDGAKHAIARVERDLTSRQTVAYSDPGSEEWGRMWAYDDADEVLLWRRK